MNVGDRCLVGGFDNHDASPIREGDRARFDAQYFITGRQAGFAFDFNSYDGATGDGLQDLDGTGTEIMLGIQADESPPVLASHGGLWKTRWGGVGLTNSIDVGPVADLDSFHCYNVVAFDNGIDPREWTVRLDSTVLHSFVPANPGDISLLFSPLIGTASSSPNFYGTIRDIVINTGKFTTSQRAAWRDYILGLTDDPPLP